MENTVNTHPENQELNKTVSSTCIMDCTNREAAKIVSEGLMMIDNFQQDSVDPNLNPESEGYYHAMELFFESERCYNDLERHFRKLVNSDVVNTEDRAAIRSLLKHAMELTPEVIAC